MINNISIENFIHDFKNYDLIIDARSPAEYAYSHIGGSINYFALSNDEHREVGTIYKQTSPFEARVKGAAYVCKNAARHIEELYKNFKPNAKIAIYCAKGGMRSSSLATIFSSIGYRIDRVVGGYKSYRGFVVDFIEDYSDFKFITLTGNTGCGKSEILTKLDNVVDLEKIANHYGSVFGAACGTQPSQKEFQNRIVDSFLKVDSSRAVFIEAESKKIGQVFLPKNLHSAMSRGYLVEIQAPIELRVERIVKMYSHISEMFFMDCMERIRPHIKGSYLEEATSAYKRGDLYATAEILLVNYYDTVYKKNYTPDIVILNNNTDEVVKNLTKIAKDFDGPKDV